MAFSGDASGGFSQAVWRQILDPDARVQIPALCHQLCVHVTLGQFLNSPCFRFLICIKQGNTSTYLTELL